MKGLVLLLRRAWRGVAATLRRRLRRPPGARAQLRTAREAMERELADGRRVMAEAGLHAARLAARVDAAARRLREIDERIATYERVGQEKLIGPLREQRARTAADHDRDARELDAARARHEDLRRRAERLQDEFRERVQRLERRIADVEAKEAQAAAAARLDDALLAPGPAAATLDELDAQLDERQARAEARVAFTTGPPAKIKDGSGRP